MYVFTRAVLLLYCADMPLEYLGSQYKWGKLKHHVFYQYMNAHTASPPPPHAGFINSAHRFSEIL